MLKFPEYSKDREVLPCVCWDSFFFHLGTVWLKTITLSFCSSLKMFIINHCDRKQLVTNGEAAGLETRGLGCGLLGSWLVSHETNARSLGAPCCARLCPTLWPFRLQPARLLCRWNFAGKNTGVGCHFLLQRSPDLYKIGWQTFSVKGKTLSSEGLGSLSHSYSTLPL